MQPIYRATHTFIHDVDITQVYVFQRFSQVTTKSDNCMVFDQSYNWSGINTSQYHATCQMYVIVCTEMFSLFMYQVSN